MVDIQNDASYDILGFTYEMSQVVIKCDMFSCPTIALKTTSPLHEYPPRICYMIYSSLSKLSLTFQAFYKQVKIFLFLIGL